MRIDRPLSEDLVGQDVALLQHEVRVLGYEIDDAEGRFGSSTHLSSMPMSTALIRSKPRSPPGKMRTMRPSGCFGSQASLHPGKLGSFDSAFADSSPAQRQFPHRPQSPAFRRNPQQPTPWRLAGNLDGRASPRASGAYSLVVRVGPTVHCRAHRFPRHVAVTITLGGGTLKSADSNDDVGRTRRVAMRGARSICRPLSCPCS